MLGDRSEFPHLGERVYLNHAAMTPIWSSVERAMHATIEQFAQKGADAWFEARDGREVLRQDLAFLLGADPEEIALMPNTSFGISSVASAIRWKSGDRIAVLRGEFPSNVTPWQLAAERNGCELVTLDAESFRGPEGLESLSAEIERGLRLLAVSAVEFQTGLRMPLEEISVRCRAAGTELFVDAIQALGGLELDVRALGIDYLAAGGHKWLMGPEGTGMLYVAAEKAQRLDPQLIGWLSHEDGTSFLSEGRGHLHMDRPLRKRADVFEVGCTNSVGFAGLGAAVARLREIGPRRVREHVQALLDRYEAICVDRGFASKRAPTDHAQLRSNILSLDPPEAVVIQELHAALLERGVVCSMPDGYLRISPHWPNGDDQIEVFEQALDSALGS